MPLHQVPLPKFSIEHYPDNLPNHDNNTPGLLCNSMASNPKSYVFIEMLYKRRSLRSWKTERWNMYSPEWGTSSSLQVQGEARPLIYSTNILPPPAAPLSSLTSGADESDQEQTCNKLIGTRPHVFQCALGVGGTDNCRVCGWTNLDLFDQGIGELFG